MDRIVLAEQSPRRVQHLTWRMAEDEVKKQAEAKSRGALKAMVFYCGDSGKL